MLLWINCVFGLFQDALNYSQTKSCICNHMAVHMWTRMHPLVSLIKKASQSDTFDSILNIS